jgi:hypothetical protein
MIRAPAFVRSIVRAVFDAFVSRVTLYPTVWERYSRRIFLHNAAKAVSFNGIDGDYVEFGCHGCRTFALAYHEMKRFGVRAKLWAFDSFQGLPPSADNRDSHPKWREKAMCVGLQEFRRQCASQGIPRGAYEVVPGFYSDSLPLLGKEAEPRNIAIAYVDCDMYSSAKDVLKFLRPRLKHGMIIAFDDYFCWSATETSGERLAASEFFAENGEWQFVPFMRYGWAGLSFVVERRVTACGCPYGMQVAPMQH